jgi:hypothetical protein
MYGFSRSFQEFKGWVGRLLTPEATIDPALKAFAQLGLKKPP